MSSRKFRSITAIALSVAIAGSLLSQGDAYANSSEVSELRAEKRETDARIREIRSELANLSEDIEGARSEDDFGREDYSGCDNCRVDQGACGERDFQNLKVQPGSESEAPRPSEGSCLKLFSSLSVISVENELPDFGEVSQSCAAEIQRCGRVRSRVSRLKNVTRKSELESELRILVSRSEVLTVEYNETAGVCEDCNRRSHGSSEVLIAGSRPLNTGEAIVAGIHAASPILTGLTGAWMHNKASSNYYNSYNNHFLPQCMTIGVPCGPPQMMAPSAFMMASAGMPGFSTGGMYPGMSMGMQSPWMSGGPSMGFNAGLNFNIGHPYMGAGHYPPMGMPGMMPPMGMPGMMPPMGMPGMMPPMGMPGMMPTVGAPTMSWGMPPYAGTPGINPYAPMPGAGMPGWNMGGAMPGAGMPGWNMGGSMPGQGYYPQYQGMNQGLMHSQMLQAQRGMQAQQNAQLAQQQMMEAYNRYSMIAPDAYRYGMSSPGYQYGAGYYGMPVGAPIVGVGYGPGVGAGINFGLNVGIGSGY